jgi:hypothetical protein
MIVAVPLVAVAKVLISHLWTSRVEWAEEPVTADGPPPPGRDEPAGVDGERRGGARPSVPVD